MTPSVRLHQLYILRSQVDLLIAMEEGVPAQEGPRACEHPEDKRRSVSNLGEEPKFKCLACDEIVAGRA